MQSNRPLFLIALLILLINLVLLSKIGELNNQINNISRNYNNLQSRLSSFSSEVDNTLARFTREQSWITPVQINHEKTQVGNEQGLAVLNWQIKDFPEGAEVVFHYRESESGEFTAIPAESIGAGLFEVNMPLKAKAEPFWEINVSKTIDSGKNSRATAVQEAVMVPGPAQSIGYYVSMKVKDTIKSSAVSYFDLAYLAQIKYEPIRGHVAINKNKNKYNISLFEHYPGSNNFASVTARFYEGNNLIAEKPVKIQKTENGAKIYSLAYEAGSQNISHLVIQVEYTNGNTFEKEIY